MSGNQRRYQLANILQEAGGLQEGVARKAAEATGVPEAEVYGVATFYHLLTNDAGDPVTGTAEYKVCAAEVRKLDSIRGGGSVPGQLLRHRWPRSRAREGESQSRPGRELKALSGNHSAIV